MIRLATLLWALLVAASGYVMFQVKYQVVQLEDELAHVNRLIDGDREQIRVLDAEWSFLNQPARLAELAKRHLKLSPITPTQISRLDQLPWRSPTPPAAAASAAPPSAPSQPTAAPRSSLPGSSR
ncbi:MAG TPA: hypothetical protein VLX85_01320 [Stellaceae bacterium]|nr:hypothetical protein [Stellaceae bacterium]